MFVVSCYCVSTTFASTAFEYSTEYECTTTRIRFDVAHTSFPYSPVAAYGT